MFERMREQLRGLELSPTRSGLENLVAELSSTIAVAQERQLSVLAAIDGLDDGGLSAATVARSVGRSSDRQAKRSARTGEVLQQMPAMRDALAAGRITQEHVEAATSAAARVEDPAGADRELVGLAAAMPADVFDKQARDWSDRRESDTAIADRYEAQRRNRHARSFRSHGDGGFGFTGTTDSSEGKQLWGAVLEEADRLYRADGGREGGADDKRTREQRQLDALVGLIKRGAGLTIGPNEESGNKEGNPKLIAAAKARSPKYQAVVTIPLERYLGTGPLSDARAELIGSGSLPDSVSDRILCDADITPLVVDRNGQPLWLGRTTRSATPGQWLALIVRDRGCKVCGAPPEHCEAHHIRFWEHGGNTDIGNFVLLCVRCHHQLHDHELELIQDPSGVWRLEPTKTPPRAKPPPTRRTRPPTRRARSNRRKQPTLV